MTAEKRPNFLLIIADDLGYSDVGCFGGEIETPHIDAMAKNGLLFTDFHASAACSPTRAMLLSGTDNHLAGMGVMSEQRGNDLERWDVPGHEGYMNFDVASLPELLADGGYYNMISGKWHLGFKQECNPHARGFHRSLAMLPGTTNHFAFEPQLGKDDWNEFFGRIPVLYTEEGKRKVFDTNEKNEYHTGFYSTSYYTDNLIRYFDERTEEDKEKPFFAMLPFSAPHWPLQCSKADREKYRGKYDDGPGALRERRLAKLKELGIIAKDVVPHDVIPESNPGVPYPGWNEMGEFERSKSAKAMECFAGMVDCIDQNVGKIKQYLEKIGELDNTFVVFMADNGAEGSALEAFPVMGENIMKVVRKYYDNKLENMGNHNSFVWYGPRWAQASTAPSKLYKMYSTEGGIRVPFVVQYPNGWPKDKMTRGFATVMDLAPTILDLAGLKHPVPSGQTKGTYKGREVYGIRGKSWVKSLSTGAAFVDKPDVFWGDDEFVGWELFGRAAIRKGKWKIVYMPAASWGTDEWQLYDLFTDPGETNDLAKTHSDKLEELKRDWDEYVKQTGTVWGVPVSTIRESWFRTPATSIGGDAFEQQDAWMEVGEGEVPKDTLPRYNKSLVREKA